MTDCIVCAQPITTTGTASLRGPTHIECWHKEQGENTPSTDAERRAKIQERVSAMSANEICQLWDRLENGDL
jgi:hypothetical protein